MRILFIGSSGFSAPTLEKLIGSKNEIAAVITQPDRPAGRGRELKFTPVKETALRKNLNILQPENINSVETIEKLGKIKPDLIIVVSYAGILKKDILNLPGYGCINLHPSLLPKYRGPAPIQWAIINGETETGVTTIFMNECVDAGDIILQEKVSISESDTAGTLSDRLSRIGAELILKTIEKIESCRIERFIQNESEASYTPLLNKKQGLIDWKLPSGKIHDFIRGLNPWPVAYSYLGNIPVKIYETRIYTDCDNELDISKNFGKIISIIEKRGLLVLTGKGKLIVSKIQTPGKKILTVEQYLKGHPINPGMNFNNGIERLL